MALTKHGFKTKFGLQIKRTIERERREGEKKRKRRRRRRKKKRSQAKRYGTMTINMNICFGLYGTTLDKDFFNLFF